MIIKKDCVPELYDWSGSSTTRILHLTERTLVGIVSGAHRLTVIQLIVAEANAVIEVAKRYVEALEEQLLLVKDEEGAQRMELEGKRQEVEATLQRLVEDRDQTAHWPALIYDWGEPHPRGSLAFLLMLMLLPDLVLAKTEAGRRLRDELSRNATLAHRDADSAERLGQVYRLTGDKDKVGANFLKPGDERTLWRSKYSWRPFLGRLAQFPAFKGEINGRIKKYAEFSSQAQWSGVSGSGWTIEGPLADSPLGSGCHLRAPSVSGWVGDAVCPRGRRLRG